MYTIIHKHGYCEVRNQFGEFILTADSETEAHKEIDMLEREWDID